MPQAERSKFDQAIAELCRTPMGKQRLVEAFEDAYVREEAVASECAKTALFDKSKVPAACMAMGRAQFAIDVLSMISRLKEN